MILYFPKDGSFPVVGDNIRTCLFSLHSLTVSLIFSVFVQMCQKCVTLFEVMINQILMNRKENEKFAGKQWIRKIYEERN